MARRVLIACIIVMLVIVGIIVYTSLKQYSLDDAIESIEDHDYDDALLILKRLSATASYEEGEKVYYYRLKALLGYIHYLNKKHASDCSMYSSTKDKKIEQRLRKKIDEINQKFGADLLLRTEPTCFIYTGGTLYEEFVSMYPASRYREIIDFEMMQYLLQLNPHTIAPVVEFYKRYPHSQYLPSLVNIFIAIVANPKVEIKDYSQLITQMLSTYCAKYSTHAEYFRIFQCIGENVNLRDSAGIHGSITGKLQKGEIVIQIERSMDSVQIGDVRDYWYKVVSVHGQRGWVFGKFLQRIQPEELQISQQEHYAIDEQFNEWVDSHTPKGWNHVFANSSEAIRFMRIGDRNIVTLITKDEGKGGLYKKIGSISTIEIRARGRCREGSVTLYAVVNPGGVAAYVMLQPGYVEVCGYRIPYDITQWHEYQLRSEGKTLSLLIDGELVARKIPLKKHDLLTIPGLYILTTTEKAHAEIEYIRVK